jgi:thymidylate synthase (FAD)
MNVELVSSTEVNTDYFKDLVDETPEDITPEQLIIYIARVSSSRTDSEKLEEHENLINYLINHKHWSPFEHAYMTVEIETSRAIGRQLIRHRSFTFQEFSQRYSEATEFENIEFREQPENNRQSSGHGLGNLVRKLLFEDHTDKSWSTENFHKANDQYQRDAMIDALRALDDIEEAYYHLLDSGVARETARMILPECTSTRIYMTGNIRSWLHFLEIRDDEHAQKEIREVAQEIGKIFQNQYPVISKALEFNYE